MLIFMILFTGCSAEDKVVKNDGKDHSTEYKEPVNNSAQESYDYIIPNITQRELTYEDLKDLPAEELALARNEIYARHGYVFESEEYNQYFSSKSWYNPNSDFNSSELSEIELHNVAFIKEYENQLVDTRSEEKYISPEMAKTYLGIVTSITDRYGLSYNEDSEGLIYADNIDFDGDGLLELYLLYKDNNFYGVKEEIWGFNGSESYLIGENEYEAGGSRTFGKLGLKQSGNKTYICYEEMDIIQEYVNEKNINIEYKSFNVQEVKGGKLQLNAYVYSELRYDEDDIKLGNGEYTKGTDYDDRKPISEVEYKEIYDKFSLEDSESLFTSGGAMFDYRTNDYNLELFTENLRNNLMTSNMKDIYPEKSLDEKKDIFNFLNQFIQVHWEGIDTSNQDRTEFAETIGSLLMYYPSFIEHEMIDYYDESFGDAVKFKFKESDVKDKILDVFGINLDFDKYPIGNHEDGYVYIGQSWDAPFAYVTRVNKMYPLGNNLFYLNIETFVNPYYEAGWEEYEKISDDLFKEISNKKEELYDFKQGYAIIREVIKDGQKSYQLIKYDHSGEYLTEEELNQYTTKVNPEPNISFDYIKIKDFTEASEYESYLKETLSGLSGEKPNDKANNEIVTYIQHAAENSSSTAVNSNKNSIVINKNIIAQALESVEETKLELDKIIKDNNIVLNRSVDIVLRVDTLGLNPNKAVSIMFDSSSVEKLGSANGIRVVLGDSQNTVYISSEDLKGLITEIGNISVNLQKGKDDDTYIIAFMDSKGEEVNQLPYPISFAFPTDNELATILVNYKGGSDNWGGQYSSSTNSIEFSTRYSGEYSILENEINITDIGHLTEKEQRTIKFMVSKGYFDLDGDKFNGNYLLTRYDFTTALVKMFFALDRELEATFSDIDKTNQFYPYIASGQKYNIVKGFEDNTFRGELNITKEQLIALCGRTLVDKKGYIYPENPNDYLNFVDNDNISDWAKVDIAIAVQNGLIENGGLLMAQTEINRAESVEILYNLFMLLYEVPPISLEINNESNPVAVEVDEAEKTISAVVAIGGGLVVIALAGGYYYHKKKNMAS